MTVALIGKSPIRGLVKKSSGLSRIKTNRGAAEVSDMSVRTLVRHREATAITFYKTYASFEMNVPEAVPIAKPRGSWPAPFRYEVYSPLSAKEGRMPSVSVDPRRVTVLPSRPSRLTVDDRIGKVEKHRDA